jgi:hypothetical protein
MTLWQETGHESQAELIAEVRHLIDETLPFIDELTPKEAGFVSNLASKLEDYGEKTFVSAKQLFWLRDIYQKIE